LNMGDRQDFFVDRVQFYVFRISRHTPINLIFVIAARMKFFIVTEQRFKNIFW